MHKRLVIGLLLLLQCSVLEVFAQAQRTGGEVVVHSWGGPVGMMANYHAAFASGANLVEWPMPHYALRHEMVVEPWQIKNGRLTLPQFPGLGIRLTPEIEARYRFRPDSAYNCRIDEQKFPPEKVWS